MRALSLWRLSTTQRSNHRNGTTKAATQQTPISVSNAVSLAAYSTLQHHACCLASLVSYRPLAPVSRKYRKKQGCGDTHAADPDTAPCGSTPRRAAAAPPSVCCGRGRARASGQPVVARGITPCRRQALRTAAGATGL